jgi:hypothetical protein
MTLWGVRESAHARLLTWGSPSALMMKGDAQWWT